MSDDLQARLDEAEALIARLQQRERHLVAAQRISHVGSYDYDVASDTVVWSDELFRIVGHEPGSLQVTAETLYLLVHPDDRQAVIDLQQQSLTAMSPYAMEQRIVW